MHGPSSNPYMHVDSAHEAREDHMGGHCVDKLEIIYGELMGGVVGSELRGLNG